MTHEEIEEYLVDWTSLSGEQVDILLEGLTSLQKSYLKKAIQSAKDEAFEAGKDFGYNRGYNYAESIFK